MSFGPTNYRQGGTRGGADQFKWEDVKNDKYRENYLGHSVQAPVGRWQKGKDLTWYNKLNKDDRAAALQDEIALAKQRDRELMDQALGIAPKRRAEPTGQLDPAEMKELLKRGASDRDGLDGERVEGLGAAPVPQEFDTKPKKTLAEKYQDDLASGRADQDIYALRGSVAAAEPGGRMDEKAMKKALKQLKKKEKKLKKEKKKEKKREKKRRKQERADREVGRHVDRHEAETRGRSKERRDRSRSSVSSSASSRSPSRSDSRSPPPRRGDRRADSRSPSRDRHRRRDYAAPRRSRSRSRSHGRRRSRSRSVEKDQRNRGSSRRSPPRRRGRSDSRDRSPPPRRRY